MTTKEKFDTLIYSDFAAYQELSERDRILFDKLFNILIFEGKITWSNEKLASILQKSVSTLEKQLSRLEKSGLILRESSRYCDYGVWKTSERIIRLSPTFFDFDFNSHAHRIYLDYLYYQQTRQLLDQYLSMEYSEFIKAFGKVKVVQV